MIIQNGRKYELIEHETYRGGPSICENINCHKNARWFFLHWGTGDYAVKSPIRYPLNLLEYITLYDHAVEAKPLVLVGQSLSGGVLGQYSIHRSYPLSWLHSRHRHSMHIAELLQ